MANLSAKVTVTVDVDMGAPYGDEWKIGEVIAKTKEGAEKRVRQLLESQEGMIVTGSPAAKIVAITQ